MFLGGMCSFDCWKLSLSESKGGGEGFAGRVSPGCVQVVVVWKTSKVMSSSPAGDGPVSLEPVYTFGGDTCIGPCKSRQPLRTVWLSMFQAVAHSAGPELS